MNYLDKLRAVSKKNKSILCLGIDPRIEKIPKAKKSKIKKSIVSYFSELILASKKEVAALKPNYAFFAQYGFEGFEALEEIISLGKKAGLPVILDAKRGDIGSSSEAYAKEAFDFWQADAVTVSPYMGFDSLAPFFDRCKNDGKGVYVLCRTSNRGASDFQVPNALYQTVANKLIAWHSEGVGAVVGATSLGELSEIAGTFAASSKPFPLLIPGVGSQGGSAAETSRILKNRGLDILIQRINASSSISYAWEGKKGDPIEHALVEIRRLNSDIGLQ